MTREQVLHASTTIINGFPTPFPVLSVATVELLRCPEAIAVCLKNPDLWQPTVNELLHYKAHFAFALPRVAMVDVPIGEAVITAGISSIAFIDSGRA